MLQIALDSEVEEFIAKHLNLTDEGGKKLLQKNGYMPQRQIATHP